MALSSSALPTCCTRSSSPIACGRSASGFTSEMRLPWPTASPRNSRTSPRAAAAMSIGSCSTATASASSRDRSSRSVASLVRRFTCSRICCRNAARVSSSRSSSSRSSMNPLSENNGVRSSCEALATNSLRTRSARSRRVCIRSNARPSWPSSSGDWSPMGRSNSPSAIRRAPCSRCERRRVTACADAQPTSIATARASAAAIRIRRSTRSAVSLTSPTCWLSATRPTSPTVKATTSAPPRWPLANPVRAASQHDRIGAGDAGQAVHARVRDHAAAPLEDAHVGVGEPPDATHRLVGAGRQHAGVR